MEETGAAPSLLCKSDEDNLVSVLAIQVRPRNDHELTIVRVVDQISTEDKLCPSAIKSAIAALDFMMNQSDSEFLVRYIRWRMANPIQK
jgi:hypothetical protein